MNIISETNKSNYIIKLTPLILVYILILLIFGSEPVGDETRYIFHAQNLWQGFVNPEKLLLANGPGYPFIIWPLVSAGASLFWIRFLNLIFIFLATIFFYKTLKHYTSKKSAIIFSYIFGLYPTFFPEAVKVLTEPATIFLVSTLMYQIVRPSENIKRKQIITASIILAFLILTKVIFAYIIIIAIIMTLLFSYRWRGWKKFMIILGLSLLLCTPYLIKTYQATGKIFYWSYVGGSSLYWASNPYPEQYGDWKNNNRVFQEEIYAPHKEFFLTLPQDDHVKQAELFTQKAIENIKLYPQKYFYNWLTNFGRLWFAYPHTNTLQRPATLGYMFVNGVLFTFLIVTSYSLWKQRRKVAPEIWPIIGFTIITLAATSLIHALPRYLNTLIPILLFLIFYTFSQIISVSWHKRDN